MTPRRQHSWDSMTLLLRNEHSGQSTNLHLSGGLQKIPIRTGLNLGRKISMKVLCINATYLVSNYMRQFLTKQATLLLRDHLKLTKSYPAISCSLLRTVLSNLVSRHPITAPFASLAMQYILSILDGRLFTFKRMNCMPLF